ncbi:MAG: 30S ribosomal protein S20 [Clostridia bacterium]|nr:30S ribosomal protein S20 [Clostridia bacterium]
MANIKSAVKRISVTERERMENKIVKSRIATSIKKFKNAVANADKTLASSLHSETVSLIDSAVSKGVLHRNNADNKKAQLGAMLSKI